MNCKICSQRVADYSVDQLCIDCEEKYNTDWEDYEPRRKPTPKLRKGSNNDDN